MRRFYDLYESECAQFDDYSLQYFKYLVYACEKDTPD